MIKLFFVAMLGVAGLMSAKTSGSTEKNLQTKKIYPWVKVVAPCGAVYYLNANNYESFEEHWEATEYYDSVKC